MITISF